MEELAVVEMEREVWARLLRLLPQHLDADEQWKVDGWRNVSTMNMMDGQERL